MRSCGVNFENSEIFRFLRGPKGGFPPKISKKKFAKNQVTPLYEKSNNKIPCFQAKNTVISDIGLGGVKNFPPVGNRVKYAARFGNYLIGEEKVFNFKPCTQIGPDGEVINRRIMILICSDYQTIA